jgi:hypothetical protein
VGPMTETQKLTHCVIIAVFLAVLASGLGRCSAAAQSPRPDMTQQELWLSRIIVSEAGYRPGREAYAILHVLEWRRTHLPAFEGWDLVRMGRAYASGFGGHRATDNPHVSRARDLAPASIPRAVLLSVRSFTRAAHGDRPSTPCPRAIHWRDRNVPPRWRPHVVRCEVPTQNVYFDGEP